MKENFDKKAFGERLKEFAKSEFNSIKGLGEEIGVDPRNLSNYTSGQREPKAKFLTILSNHGCDINWLLTGKKAKPESSLGRLEEFKELIQQITELQTQLKVMSSRLEELENK